MTGFTAPFINKLVAHGLGIQAFPMPAGVWLIPHIGDPGPAGLLNAAATTNRVKATWKSPDDGISWLTAELAFVLSLRQQITHLSGWDSLTGGMCMFTDTVKIPKNFYAGDTVTLPTLGVGIKAAA